MLNKENTALVVIDIQERFVPAIAGIDSVIKNTEKLVKACDILKVPVISTEQYPKGLGKTVVKGLSNPIEKIHFDCFKEDKFCEKIKKTKKLKNLIIAGIEAHVCVLQSLISAVKKGLNVHLVTDAISSRKKSDKDIAVERAKQEGAMLATTEMVIFQLLEKAGTPEFREISRLVK